MCQPFVSILCSGAQDLAAYRARVLLASCGGRRTLCASLYNRGARVVRRSERCSLICSGLCPVIRTMCVAGLRP